MRKRTNEKYLRFFPLLLLFNALQEAHTSWKSDSFSTRFETFHEGASNHDNRKNVWILWPPCPHLELICCIKFTQPPLLRLLFHVPPRKSFDLHSVVVHDLTQTRRQCGQIIMALTWSAKDLWLARPECRGQEVVSSSLRSVHRLRSNDTDKWTAAVLKMCAGTQWCETRSGPHWTCGWY